MANTNFIIDHAELIGKGVGERYIDLNSAIKDLSDSPTDPARMATYTMTLAAFTNQIKAVTGFCKSISDLNSTMISHT